MNVAAAEPAGGILHHGKCLRENLFEAAFEGIEILDLREFLLPSHGLLRQRLVGQPMQPLFDLVDFFDQRPDALQFALIASADDLAKDPLNHDGEPRRKTGKGNTGELRGKCNGFGGSLRDRESGETEEERRGARRRGWGQPRHSELIRTVLRTRTSAGRVTAAEASRTTRASTSSGCAEVFRA